MKLIKTKAIEKKFTAIYDQHSWEGESLSGPGSDMQYNDVYLEQLNRLLGTKIYGISSVLDVGCGDWSLSKHVDWSQVDYTGIDIVESVISTNNQIFSGENRRFFCLNILEDKLPSADLLIVKDVLQHLSGKSIMAFLSLLTNYRFALITNDVRSYVSFKYIDRLWVSHPSANKEIIDGDWRPVSLREKPFLLQANPIAYYNVPHKKGLANIDFCKEILFWKREY